MGALEGEKGGGRRGDCAPTKKLVEFGGDFTWLEHGKTNLQILYICPRKHQKLQL